MFQNQYFPSKKHSITVVSLCAAALLAACSPKPEQPQESESQASQVTINISGSSQNSQSSGQEPSTQTAAAASQSQSVPDAADSTTSAPKAEDLTARFGEYCIAEQTFEVDLSEYNGKVWFVPFSPSDGQDFHIQIIQNDHVLADVPGYVLPELMDQPFSSLDAVSFYDINFDGNTDILLVETYGSTTFASVYYGFDPNGEEYMRYFISQEHLSASISHQAKPLTVSQIRSFLSGGKKNGEFSDYKEAYKAVAALWTQAETGDIQYSLIYVDDDDIPELAAGVSGYYVSLYTYKDGKVYPLMDQWSYGVMGNAGYEYCPRKNSLRNDNSDYAGAILYTTYMTMTDSHSIRTTAEIVTYNFDDVNGNGSLDDNETDSVGLYGISYIDGVEATPEQCAAYDAGQYEFIVGTMSLNALMAALN